MPQKKLLTMCFASIFLSGCTTALTVTDFLFTPIGSGIHVYYTKDEIFAPYVKAEKEFSPDPTRVEGIKKTKLEMGTTCQCENKLQNSDYFRS